MRLTIKDIDVFRFEDGSGEAVFGDVEHGSAELFGGGDVLGEGFFEEGEDGIEDGVEGLVEPGL